MKSRNWPLMLITVSVALSCGRSGSPLEPKAAVNEPVVSSVSSDVATGNRILWGMWILAVSSDHSRLEVIPDRTALMHLNAVRLLEVQPCTTCLKINNLSFLPDNKLQADLQLTHPVPGNNNLTGFDVRGILVTAADYVFPASGRGIASGSGIIRMLNPDGYTSLFNPTEFPESGPAPYILKYVKGKYSPGGDLSATLNPFVAYNADQPRRIFASGTTSARTVLLQLPPGPLRLGYAVDASWKKADGPVIDPVNDFPPEANCLEAYGINLVNYVEIPEGQPTTVAIEVSDHQGLNTISEVTIEAPDLFDGEITLGYQSSSGPETHIYTGQISNEKSAPLGEYPVLVRVKDSADDPNLGLIQAWNLVTVKVGLEHGWARTWGGPDGQCVYSVATDNNGHVYVVGAFRGTVDFDPGSGTVECASNGDTDPYLSKFDYDGNLLWALSWGGTAPDRATAVAADGLGNVYVTGRWASTVDFDPGPGSDEHTADMRSLFLSKFDSSGDFLWVRTWGAGGDIEAYDLTTDNAQNILVTGMLQYVFDLDPGPGEDIYDAGEYPDIFLSKFTSSGDYVWGMRLGNKNDWNWGCGVGTDDGANVYMAGAFGGTVDFDPSEDGKGVHTANGTQSNFFLVKFDPNRQFQWARTWGGPEFRDYPHTLAVTHDGFSYVTGYFEGTMDFDPGPDGDLRTSNGYTDACMSKLDANGNYLWALSWGGSGKDTALSASVDSLGHCMVLGGFSEQIDLDPGPGVDLRGSIWEGYFLSKYQQDGTYEWGATWEGLDYLPGNAEMGVSTDSNGYSFCGGWYRGTVDFDPGPA